MQESKLIKLQGKGINLEELQPPSRPNLSLIEDKKINESEALSQERMICDSDSQVRLYDTICDKTRCYMKKGRIISQRSAFEENYKKYSQLSFKLRSGIFEQYSNFQVGMKAYMNPMQVEFKRVIPICIPKSTSRKLKPSKPREKHSNYFETVYNNPIKYQNDLSLRIHKEQIRDQLNRTKRTISMH